MKKQTAIQVIEATVNYYSEDVSRRSLSPTEKGFGDKPACLYKGPNGKLCAFARYVKPEFRHLLVEEENADAQFAESEKGYDLLLPSVSHLHNANFWSAIQTLHDYSSYWHDKGLTTEGLAYVGSMKDRYKDLK